MSLDIQQIEHIANLARIELTALEQEKFASQLSSILDYVDKLKKTPVTSVLPADGGTFELTNVFRADATSEDVFDVDLAKQLIALAPETDNGQVKVEKIF